MVALGLGATTELVEAGGGVGGGLAVGVLTGLAGAGVGAAA